MPSYPEFEERLSSLFALELRRQGIPDVDEWIDRLHRYGSYVPAAQPDLVAPITTATATATTTNTATASSSVSSSAQRRSHASYVLVLDMTNVNLGDRPAVALCEALLKADPLNPRRRVHGDCVVEWQLILRHCGLTDRALSHLALLLAGCPKLAVLDVSMNAFTEQGRMTLLQTAAEVPCDVIIAGDRQCSQDPHESSHEEGTAEEANSPPPRCASPPPPSLLSSSQGRHHKSTASPQQRHPSQASLRRFRRSPSLTTTSTSFTHSQRGYASGSAEALQRRREELFGPTPTPIPTPTAAAAAAAEAAPAAASASPVPTAVANIITAAAAAGAGASPAVTTRAEPAQAERAKSAEESSEKREDSAEATQRAVSSSGHNNNDGASSPAAPAGSFTSSSPPLAQPVVADGSHSPFRTDITAPHSPSEASGRRFSAAGRSTDLNNAEESHKENKRNSNSNSNSSGDGVNYILRGGSDSSGAKDAQSREPFIDRNDQLDVTANLNPALDSVLDLSALTARDGTLRQAHMFGGAETIWDVLSAYEQAAEQQQQQQTEAQFYSESEGGGGVDAALRAKLPAALLGSTTYNAITVLNLSRNHLTSLCALPATLLRLDVSSNALTELSGLQSCKMLTVLNARRNELRCIRGLERNLGVAHLFLGHNRITVIEGLAHLVLLETLDVTFNQLRTQTSIRMLSLCSALRHLLLRGNPIMESGKPGILTVLRNLCPTLLVIDEQRVGSAKLADRAMQRRSWGLQPNMIDSTAHSSNSKNSTTTAGVSVSAVATSGLLSASSALSRVAMNALAGHHDDDDHHRRGRGSMSRSARRTSNYPGGSMEESRTLSQPFTGSRRRDGSCRPAPFATSSMFTTSGEADEKGAGAAADDVVDADALDLLHLLTRGVTAPTGYGDTANTRHAAQYLAKMKKIEEEKAEKQRARRLTANGRPLRGAVVKQLAEESRRYVEETIMRRLTTQQQQLSNMLQSDIHPNSANANAAAPLMDSPVARACSTGGGRSPSFPPHEALPEGDTAAGGVVSPRPQKKITQQTAAAAAAAAGTENLDPVTAEVLRRYELHTKPIRRRRRPANSVKQPMVATTHAAELRAASARQSLSRSTSRPQSPARPITATAPAADSACPTSLSPPAEGASKAKAAATGSRGEGGGSGGARGTQPGARRGPGGERPAAAFATAPRAFDHPSSDVDATLDAMYVEDVQNGRGVFREAVMSSYAALHLAERSAAAAAATAAAEAATNRSLDMLDEAEIECSPISKDPQARLVTSLNTTSASVHERSNKPHHRRPREAAAPPALCQQSTAPATLSHAPSCRAAAGAATTPSRSRSSSSSSRGSGARIGRSSPPTHIYASNPARSGADPLRRGPAAAEETAIYPASRSHSQSSRGGGGAGGRADAAAAAYDSTKPTTKTVPQPAQAVARRHSTGHTTATPAADPRRSHSRHSGSSSGSRGARAAEGGTSPSRCSHAGRSRSASLAPLHIDAAQRTRVRGWCSQLAEDAAAVQEALRTLTDLLEAQRQAGQPFPESSRELPQTYLRERHRCVEILRESGMLADTQVPMDVVVYYGLSRSELEGEVDRSAEVVPREHKSEQTWLHEVGERAEVLRLVHLLGDAKTCLRYVSLLVGDGRERLLQQYVDQLKDSLRS